MATKKKMLQAAAGNAGGAGLDITDVFSTYLYTGNNDNAGNTQTITNGIDLDGEGGLVWVKNRSGSSNHIFVDTERGINNALRSNSTSANTVYSGDAEVVNGFNSNGFDIGEGGQVNYLNNDYASWTFRKAPKFFDVVTWTGDGVAGRQIPHDLGTTVGTLIIRRTDSSQNWFVWHRAYANNQWLVLNDNYDLATTGTTSELNSTTPTDSVFTVGSGAITNASGGTYVAYLFAHNDGDGGFGPDGDQDIIKCGSAVCDSNGYFQANLGFEPQWVLVKSATVAQDWHLVDTMRGMTVGNTYPTNPAPAAFLYPNLSNAETSSNYGAKPTATGFEFNNGSSFQTYIYMAIRRGPLAQPESGTEVFETEIGDGVSTKPALFSGFPVDAAFLKLKTGGDSLFGSRLQGPYYMQANLTNAETDDTGWTYDYMNGWYGGTARNSNFVSWMFRRAPGFFDVVAYTGDGVAGRTVSHNLGVAPEMMWVKRRSGTGSWYVYGGDETKVAYLNSTSAFEGPSSAWASTAPTNTAFTVGSETSVNASGSTYIAYLFATLAGVSKVGSYTGNGTSQTIDCGFSSGARFVLIKKTSAADDWIVHDSERGIIAGVGDPSLRLNNTDPERSNTNYIDPDPSGFTLATGENLTNQSGENYIFYAIA